MLNKKNEEENRRKVVMRRLPISFPKDRLLALLSFCAYNRFCFRNGRYYSRAYIELKTPADVGHFATFCNHHPYVFVDDNGHQFKPVLEYAPSQRLPNICHSAIKDTREGTIFKDPDYLEFLKLIAIPAARFDLEKIQTQPSGVSLSLINPGSTANKQGPKKEKNFLKNSTENLNQKDKVKINGNSLTASRKDNQHATVKEKALSKIQSVSSVDGRLSRVALTKDSEKEFPQGKDVSAVSRRDLQRPGNALLSSSPKRSNRFCSKEMIRGILVNNKAHENQSLSAVQSRHKIQNLNTEHNKQGGSSSNVPRTEPSVSISDPDAKRTLYGKFLTKDCNDIASGVKQETCARNKDSFHSVVPRDNEKKFSICKLQDSGCHSGSVKGSRRHFWCNVASHSMKNEGSPIVYTHKSSKRGGSSYAAQEKQVWVQKSASSS